MCIYVAKYQGFPQMGKGCFISELAQEPAPPTKWAECLGTLLVSGIRMREQTQQADAEGAWNPHWEGPCPSECSGHRELGEATERNSIPGVNNEKAAGLWAFCQAHWREAEDCVHSTCSELLSIYRWQGCMLCVNSREGAETKQQHSNIECYQAPQKGIRWPERVKNKESRQSGHNHW